MKKLFSIVTVAAVMAASCNSSPRTAGVSDVAPAASVQQADTTGLAQYQAWKAQNELAPVTQAAATTPVAPETRTVVKYVPVKASSSSSTRSSGTVYNSTSSSSNTAKASQKKGISKAAKGAVIGGVAGAAGGAILNKKNRAVGAVIGGVLGAAGGYGIGRGMDRKDGRIE